MVKLKQINILRWLMLIDAVYSMSNFFRDLQCNCLTNFISSIDETLKLVELDILAWKPYFVLDTLSEVFVMLIGGFKFTVAFLPVEVLIKAPFGLHCCFDYYILWSHPSKINLNSLKSFFIC